MHLAASAFGLLVHLTGRTLGENMRYHSFFVPRLVFRVHDTTAPSETGVPGGLCTVRDASDTSLTLNGRSRLLMKPHCVIMLELDVTAVR